MKKTALILFSCLLSGVLFAQYKISINKNASSYDESTFTINQFISPQKISTGAMKPLRSCEFTPVNGSTLSNAAAVTSPVALYRRPKGTYMTGLSPKGNALYPSFAGHGCINWKFLNYSKNATAYNWSMNGTTFSTDSNAIYNPTIGFYYMPSLTASASGKLSTYKYGDKQANQYLFVGKAFLPITNAKYYTDSTTSGVDSYVLSGGSYGKYAFGSGLTIPNLSTTASNAVYSFHEKPIAPLYVDSIYAVIYSASGKPIPADKVMNMYILRVDSVTGAVTNDTIAKSTCGSADLISISPNIFSMPFVFKDIDEFGFETTKGIVLNKQFVLKFSGFSEPGFDLGFMSDYYNPIDKTAAFDIGGKVYSWNGRYNLYVSLHAAFTTLYAPPANRVVTAPAEGGYGVDKDGYISSLYSTFLPIDKDGFRNWEVQQPSWVEVQYDTTYFKSKSIVAAVLVASALPRGVTARTGDVTISCYGVKTTLTINQTTATGIQNVANKVFQVIKVGNSFVVEYPSTYTKLSIFNTEGKLEESIELDGSGRCVIDKKSLSKGLLIFNATGNSNSLTTKLIN